MMGMEPTVRVPLKRRTAGTIRLFGKLTKGCDSGTLPKWEGRETSQRIEIRAFAPRFRESSERFPGSLSVSFDFDDKPDQRLRGFTGNERRSS